MIPASDVKIPDSTSKTISIITASHVTLISLRLLTVMCVQLINLFDVQKYD